jgi:hypothetical protein
MAMRTITNCGNSAMSNRRVPGRYSSHETQPIAGFPESARNCALPPKNVAKLAQAKLSELRRCRRLPNWSPPRTRPLRNSATGLAKDTWDGW